MPALPARPTPPSVRPLAAAHFKDALRALESGNRPAAVRALLDIDPESWTGIEHRLALLGEDLAVLLTLAATDVTR
ncbi:hypothetical protein LO771_10400 [Streptacidiphilus sp. ASG 303]|uniref:hypothetical protein n=1 Tax=Streptacidiphilus sp. ASG 303 TaxID=2896847 RepID=UPI001E32289A|nr:hypothetical protein [Streptacidiphilus sp. ASG 303]MCD0482797.1 hypothetical protein [Streptacidiphilus sp. ASG 303]